MMRTTLMWSGWMIALLTLLSGCVLPKTYTNEFITSHNPKNAYKIGNFATSGYFADQLVLAMQQKMPALALHEGDGDVSVQVSSSFVMMPAGKRQMKPVVTTVTLQVVRTSDREIIYSLVKQYEIQITKGKKGISVNTAGWVDQAAAELAQGVANAIGLEG